VLNYLKRRPHFEKISSLGSFTRQTQYKQSTHFFMRISSVLSLAAVVTGPVVFAGLALVTRPVVAARAAVVAGPVVLAGLVAVSRPAVAARVAVVAGPVVLAGKG
jgi:hypothetical protein